MNCGARAPHSDGLWPTSSSNRVAELGLMPCTVNDHAAGPHAYACCTKPRPVPLMGDRGGRWAGGAVKAGRAGASWGHLFYDLLTLRPPRHPQDPQSSASSSGARGLRGPDLARDLRGVTRGGDGRRGGWPAAAIEGVPRSRPRPAVADSPSRVRAPHACRRLGAARAAPRRRALRPTPRHRAPSVCRAPPSPRRLKAVDVANDEGRARGQ